MRPGADWRLAARPRDQVRLRRGAGYAANSAGAAICSRLTQKTVSRSAILRVTADLPLAFSQSLGVRVSSCSNNNVVCPPPAHPRCLRPLRSTPCAPCTLHTSRPHVESAKIDHDVTDRTAYVLPGIRLCVRWAFAFETQQGNDLQVKKPTTVCLENSHHKSSGGFRLPVMPLSV